MRGRYRNLAFLMAFATSSSHAETDIPPGLGLSPDGKAELSTARADESVERILWDGVPIAITIGVGRERIIQFPGSVRLGIPSQLLPYLRTQSQHGSVYWLATRPFAATRLQVQDSQNGQFYLIDLTATDKPTSQSRIEVINTTAQAPEGAHPSHSDALAENNNGIPSVPPKLPGRERQKTTTVSDYAVLTRYAAQQLYAPARLLKTPEGVHAASFNSDRSDTLLRGSDILAEPVAAWRKGNLYVTAVKLTNRSAHTVVLDPRLLRGQWRTATLQHAQLGGTDSDTSVTALYLVSDRPVARLP
ncbi:TIGR03749 family integrating conjugative element protein [Crenothrix polyspora]|uniref:Integrating conjugative element protein, PFL_4704 family n=1 Tax=Crenothrix polyspora TaxID=360316 RepID=A0A1R4H4D3_9GAMM|nr:TIGR03749 family integrating conjugative element protein [Crenothrix polyspora]SJM91046.1 Integrating conjugative element protein, PFL_4704 family [Crenothrix polyspora]